jgi:hypothetical protein
MAWMDRPGRVLGVSLPLSVLLTMPTIAAAAVIAGGVTGGIKVQFRHCVGAVAQLRMCCVVGY